VTLGGGGGAFHWRWRPVIERRFIVVLGRLEKKRVVLCRYIHWFFEDRAFHDFNPGIQSCELQCCVPAEPWDFDIIYFFIFNNILNRAKTQLNFVLQRVPPLQQVLLAMHVGDVTSLFYLFFNIYTLLLFSNRGTRWRSWFRHCTRNRKVAGLIRVDVQVALESTQPLTEMSTRNIYLGGKGCR
jgi:hypothetical protein